MKRPACLEITRTNSNDAAEWHPLPQSPPPPAKPQKHPGPQLPPNPRVPQLHLSPLSKGQEPEKQLKELAARNAVGLEDSETDKRWQMARDARAVELAIGRELTITELTLMLDEWCRLSIINSKERDDHLAAFLVEVRKVRVATGEGDTVNKAVDRVSKLPSSELVQIPGIPNAPESWRRVLTMHREMFRLTGRNVYFLSCRDAAKAFPGLSHQTANDINSLLVKQGVIKIECRGDAHRATRFRYLSSE
jgi:hypothetical protein